MPLLPGWSLLNEVLLVILALCLALFLGGKLKWPLLMVNYGQVEIELKYILTALPKQR